MMNQIPNSKEWIELLIKKNGYETDGEAAASLGALRQSVQQWRTGRVSAIDTGSWSFLSFTDQRRCRRTCSNVIPSRAICKPSVSNQSY